MNDVPPRATLAAATGGATARFVTGSTMRHVTVMTATGSVGLMAVFLVDLLSLLYISWLGDPRLTAAVGIGTIVLYLSVSINVGSMIAVGALVSKALGAGHRADARRLAGSACVHMGLIAVAVSGLLLAGLPWLLPILGASDDILPIAQRFLWITMPSNILMAIGMGFSGVLRAVGDANRSMYVTLTGGLVTAVVDPLLIFGLGLGVEGAAIAIVLARLVFVLVGYWGAVRIHDLVARPTLRDAVADAGPMYAIALPAMLTNVATPVAGAFLATVVARFGEAAIAANAIIDRLVPVAFGGLFALSGAIGPILGQNWGAGRFDRMRDALRDGILFTALYVGGVWAVLLVLRHPLADLFQATGLTAELVVFFCLVSGAIWFFNGLLFTANASFNNLGFPFLSTAFNWGRATIGTMPFAAAGAWLAGPHGAIAGVGFGSLIFGVAAIVTAFWSIRTLERRAASDKA